MEEVSFFELRCEGIPSLNMKSSVAETNILVTSICDSPSHMWNVLLVTSPDYFSTLIIFKLFKTQNFCKKVCSLFICATLGDFDMSFIHILTKEMPLDIKVFGVLREAVRR